MSDPTPTPRKPAARTAPARTAPTRKAPAKKPAARPISGLDGAHVFLTGATGFVGQAVLERLLVSFPTTRVSILVRGMA